MRTFEQDIGAPERRFCTCQPNQHHQNIINIGSQEEPAAGSMDASNAQKARYAENGRTATYINVHSLSDSLISAGSARKLGNFQLVQVLQDFLAKQEGGAMVKSDQPWPILPIIFAMNAMSTPTIQDPKESQREKTCN